MDTEAMYFKDGDVLDYTPAAAKIAGQMVQFAGLAGYCVTAIAASVLGALQVEGIAQAVCDLSVGNVGDVVGWDEDGDPVGGTAGSGALTTNLANVDFLVGSLTVATAAADTSAKVALNKYSAEHQLFAGKSHELHIADYSIDVQDSGKVLHIADGTKTFTLPATLAGLEVIVVNDGADGTLVTISPAAADKITGMDLAGADDGDLTNTAVTAIKGDYVILVGNGGDGWFVKAKRGIWAVA